MKPLIWKPILAAAILLAGCTTTHELAMPPAKSPVVDNCAASTELPKYKRVMLVPPAGRGRSDIDGEFAAIERELIRNGVTLLTADGLRDDPSLRDLEKVFAAARDTGAEAILEIRSFGTARGVELPGSTRYFAPEGAGVIRQLGDEVQRMVMIKSGGKPLVETDEESYSRLSGDARKRSRAYTDDVLELSGRLIDVKTREVVISLHYLVPVARCGRPYFEIVEDSGKTTESAYAWDADDSRRARRAVARKMVITKLADRLSGDGAR